jgi:hypothetical protein
MGSEVRVAEVESAAYEIPTELPEADGTLEWTSTTLVIAEVAGGGASGLGYTYGDRAASQLIRGKLAELVRGRDAFAVPAAVHAMSRAVRNLGRPVTGHLAPDPSRPGLGLELKRADARRYQKS